MPTADPVIRTEGLSKRFGRLTAVDNATFEVPAGTVAGFVGPNGAGKTTTMRMLLGLVRPSSGRAEVLGKPVGQPAAYLSRVGALIEGPAFYGDLSARQNLRVLATLGRADARRIDRVLEQVDLARRADDAYKSYSLGMKQRLGIAAALLRQPELLMLDEPTNGLDPSGIRDMRNLIRDIARSGPTVFLSSHLLAEVQSICDYLVIVERGRLLYQGPIGTFLKPAGETFTIRTDPPSGVERVAELAVEAGLRVEREGERLTLVAPHTCIAELSRALHREDIVLTEIAPAGANLEERFLQLVGGAP